MAHPLQLGFQDAASPAMEEYIYFYDISTLLVVIISTTIFLIMFATLFAQLTNKAMVDSPKYETFWTLLPIVTLLVIAVPSMRILYMLEEQKDPDLTIKAIGHQWYWTYEYSDYNNMTFDAYMIPTQFLAPGQFRLLDADHRMVIPIMCHIRVLVSAEDVLHSWAVPSLGVKMDAIPGQLNQIILFTPRIGIFYGQCSEICGANHSFMPIVAETIPLKHFEEWVITML